MRGIHMYMTQHGGLWITLSTLLHTVRPLILVDLCITLWITWGIIHRLYPHYPQLIHMDIHRLWKTTPVLFIAVCLSKAQ